LYVAKLYPPSLVASVGTASCVVAALLDFWLIGWFVSHGLARSKLDQSRLYQIASRIFQKAPFLLIAGSALAPVPFYPVKILAIAASYPPVLFIIAVLVGRWPRFYLLAIGGREVQAPNSWLLAAAVILEVLTVLGIWQTRRRSRTPEL
jgi:membrane protein YqaA with SNARE-associated domain